MRTAIVIGVLLAASVAAANPIVIDMYVDFDPPNFVSSTYPTLYSTIFAYAVADLTGAGGDAYAVHFDMDTQFGASMIVGSFVPATPVYTVQIVDNGITVIAPDCFGEPLVTLGYLPLLCTAPDIVRIRPHVDNGHVFVTCGTMEEYEYCYVMYGGIGMEPPSPEGLCGSPVEDIAWGAIKALYR